MEKSHVRLIRILRHPDLDIDKVRLDIRGSLMLDMAHDDEFDVLIERLVGVIRNPPE